MLWLMDVISSTTQASIYVLYVLHLSCTTLIAYHVWLCFEFVAEGTAGSDFFPEGLIFYPRCAVSIDYFNELMYLYTVQC